jgi:uncharacterized protein with NAD-binding domain and iron-sulfur cluster
LADAALDVVIYDSNAAIAALGPWTALGGKARSQYFQRPETGATWLPGEHGFRFFPAFYKNTFDTLDRIPITHVPGARSRGTVFDRLRPARHWGATYADGRHLSLARRRPRDAADVLGMVRFLLGPRFSAADVAILSAGLGRALAMMLRGQDEALDQISLWELLQADRLSLRTQRFLQTMPRALVAMDPRRGSARTLLFTLWRLSADHGRTAPGDFVLTGPTSEAWFEPWFEHLESKGVRFALGPEHRLNAFAHRAGSIESRTTGRRHARPRRSLCVGAACRRRAQVTRRGLSRPA